MIMRRFVYIMCTSMVLLLVSCTLENIEVIPNANKTVIMYIAGDNSLYSYATSNINSILNAYTSDIYNNLIIYADIYGKGTQILKVDYDYTTQYGYTTVIQEYDDEDSGDVSILKTRIAEIQRLYPADSYGLILWSHGYGWYPSDISYSINSSYASSKELLDLDNMTPLTKWFGQDGSSKMEIDEIAEALPTNFDFIVFDACLMACAEVVYALKDNTDYMICSAAEVLASGFPYKNIKLYMEDNSDYDAICQGYYDHYNSQSGTSRSATISLIKTSEIDEFRDIAKSIVDNNAEAIAKIDVSSVQQFDRRSDAAGHIFVDALSFIRQIASEQELEQFNDALENVVLSKYNTPYYFYNESTGKYSAGGFEIAEHCGLTLYMPQSKLPAATTAYQDISWSK